MTSASDQKSERELYIINLKHGTWYQRLSLDGPAGPQAAAKLNEIREEALEMAKDTADIVDFQRRVLQMFAANDFHRCDT